MSRTRRITAVIITIIMLAGILLLPAAAEENQPVIVNTMSAGEIWQDTVTEGMTAAAVLNVSEAGSASLTAAGEGLSVSVEDKANPGVVLAKGDMNGGNLLLSWEAGNGAYLICVSGEGTFRIEVSVEKAVQETPVQAEETADEAGSEEDAEEVTAEPEEQPEEPAEDEPAITETEEETAESAEGEPETIEPAEQAEESEEGEPETTEPEEQTEESEEDEPEATEPEEQPEASEEAEPETAEPAEQAEESEEAEPETTEPEEQPEASEEVEPETTEPEEQPAEAVEDEPETADPEERPEEPEACEPESSEAEAQNEENPDEEIEDVPESEAEETKPSEEIEIARTIHTGEEWNGILKRKKPTVLKLEAGNSQTIHMLVEGIDVWAQVQKTGEQTGEAPKQLTDPETNQVMVSWNADADDYLIFLGANENSLLAKVKVVFMDQEAFETWKAENTPEEPAEQPEEEPEAEPEETTEEQPAADAEDRPEGEPDPIPEKNRSIRIDVTWDTPDPVIGDVAHFKAILDGYEGLTYTMQWQYSPDHEEWIDLQGETSDSMDIVVTEENNVVYWRIAVYIENDQES